MSILVLSLLTLTACSGGPSDSGTGSAAEETDAANACAGLCTDAGFSGGTETDYGGGLVECVCEGSGGAITQDACSAYCSGYDVDAAHSYLSENAAPNDKCVCDGTSG